MSSVVGAKGQVTIEHAIREELGIGPGWRAVQHIDDGRVVVEFLPPRHRRSLAGILRGATPVRAATDEVLREAINDAWSEPRSDEPGANGDR